MFTLSNVLSFLRAPLALVFAYGSMPIRLISVVLSMVTDSIDGFIARRSHTATRFGAILDPLMDKFFVYTCLVVFLSEEKLLLWQAVIMISRDIALCLFAIYLTAMRKWRTHPFKSLLWGKVSTALQFLTLISITLGLVVPTACFYLFIVLGFFALYELFTAERPSPAGTVKA